MGSPGVSVVIPTYKRAHLVGRAIRSALAAIVPGDEILVVDDGSEDDTSQVVEAFGGPVRFLPQPHAGAGATRNAGIRAATRELIAFLDSDDEWMPDKLTLMRALLEKRPDVLYCFSDFFVRDEGSDRIEHQFIKNWHKDPRSWHEILAPGVAYSTIAPLPAGRADFQIHIGDMYLLEMLSNFVQTSTCVTRRVEPGSALHFADDVKLFEDKECFGSLAGRGLAAYLDCETSCQWGHAGERVTDVNTYNAVDGCLKIMERVWGQDANFLKRHQQQYDDKRKEQLLMRARWLIARGRTSEARADLRRAGESPFSYRLLSSLPGPVVRGLLRVKRAVVRG